MRSTFVNGPVIRRPIRLLLVEDSSDDALLLQYELRRAGYDGQFTPLATAVTRYVQTYLNAADRYR